MSSKAPGVLINSGRECDVFDIGGGRVLRRSRLGRPAATEALTIAHVAHHGYPVPRVFDVDGHDLVLERIEGCTMFQAFRRTPWKVSHWGSELARLIEQLGAIPVPQHSLVRHFGDGDTLTHVDLHPSNVMITSTGPIVIDWGTATAAKPGIDAALTWLTLASGEIEAPAPIRLLGNAVRNVLVNSYTSAINQEQALEQLQVAFDYRRSGPNIKAVEIERMRNFLRTVTLPVS